MALREIILKTVVEHNLWDFRSRLILAVSGGRDSMVMFQVMRFIAPDPMRQLVTVHIDHNVRQESADDAKFVEQVSVNAGIPFISLRMDNPRPPQGVSAEQHWRTERYKMLHAVCVQTGAIAIATAHTATDHIETILMRLVTGAGPRGFLGIRLARSDGIIRPLLHVTRDEVTAYANREGIFWREDTTNIDTARPRNAIRKHIVPILQSINREAERNVVRSSTLLADEDAFLSNYALNLLTRAKWNNVLPALLDTTVFHKESGVIIRRCASALYDSLGSLCDFRVSESHVRALAECLAGNRAFCPLPGAGRAILKGQQIVLLPGVSQADRLREIKVLDAGIQRVGAYSVTVCHSSKPPHDTMVVTNPCIRTRRPNDIFENVVTSRTERLSEILRRRSVPMEIRPLLPLLVDRYDRVIWIPDPFQPSDITICIQKNRWIKLTCKPISAIRC